MNESQGRARIHSLDIMRGAVIVLMAIDHVRDFWSQEAFAPEDLTQTTPGYFFTRWITHFCAPVFVFLAGASARLYADKVQDTGAVSRFLLVRGLWLIAVEILIVNLAWSLAPLWASWGFFLQVIWAIGVSMVALAALVWLPVLWIGVISLAMIFFHNAFNAVVPTDLGSLGWLWQVLHEGGWVALNAQGNWGVYFAYPLIPWIGVMGAGYVFGQLMHWPADQRRRALLYLGLGAIALFVLLRFSNLYGDTGVWSQQKNALYTLMSFINTQKYPPSLLFLLMTLGPALLLLILFERRQARVFQVLRVFGRVPFFFYLLHFFFIHFTALLYFRLVHGQWFSLVNNQNSANWPDFYQPSLLRLYLAWGLTVWVFYYLCRWYDRYKSSHSHWWLKYL